MLACYGAGGPSSFHETSVPVYCAPIPALENWLHSVTFRWDWQVFRFLRRKLGLFRNSGCSFVALRHPNRF